MDNRYLYVLSYGFFRLYYATQAATLWKLQPGMKNDRAVLIGHVCIVMYSICHVKCLRHNTAIYIYIYTHYLLMTLTYKEEMYLEQHCIPTGGMWMDMCFFNS